MKTYANSFIAIKIRILRVSKFWEDQVERKDQWFNLLQFSSVAQSCPTLCNPMNHSTPGLPVHHQLAEFTQTHIHQVSDAIQPSYPLSSPSLPAPNPPSIRILSNESTLRMRWPKYRSFSFSIQKSNWWAHIFGDNVIRMDNCSRLKMTPKKQLHPNPGTCEYYLIFADVIKLTLLR